MVIDDEHEVAGRSFKILRALTMCNNRHARDRTTVHVDLVESSLPTALRAV